MPRGLKALELYCGIGGFSAAAGESVTVAAAVDISAPALTVYRDNFPHPVHGKLVDGLTAVELARLECDLWWASPPCQPFTRRGRRRDLEDPRAATFKRLVSLLGEVRPRYFAMENVEGFETSQARDLLLETLEAAGYAAVLERLLCPSELGLPNRRPRYYLVAGRGGLRSLAPLHELVPELISGHLEAMDEREEAALRLDPALASRYRGALHVVASDEPGAVTHCFTSAYGRSPVRSGSYLETSSGPRHFSPREILSLLGFPPSFRVPPHLDRRSGWRLAGNSLSLPAVRHMLRAVPELA